MSRPHTLSGLTDREACSDALYRCLAGLDHNDHAIFDTAFVGEDVTMLFNGTEFKGLSTIKNAFLVTIGPMVTSHMITNQRVDLKGDGKSATINAYALAQHAPPGTVPMEGNGPKYLAASEYFIDLVKIENEWKIIKWAMQVLWSQGDASVMPGSG